MMVKRILFIEVNEHRYAKACHDLESKIEASKDIDLFESDIYIKNIAGKEMLGLSIIGVDGELFEYMVQKDYEIVNIGNDIQSFLKDFDNLKILENDEILVLDSDFETFKLGQIQIISD